MKKHTMIHWMILFLLFSTSAKASALSEQIDQTIGDTRNFLCSTLGLNHIPSLQANCGLPATEFKQADLNTLIAGRFRIFTHGKGGNNERKI